MKSAAITDADSIALPRAADDNFVVHATWVPLHTPGMQVVEEAQLTIVDSGLACDTFNFICRARLDEGNVGERVAGAVGHFRRVGRPFSWWVGPADLPADLGEHLVRAGLERAETELAMAADLATIGAVRPVPGLEIRRVDAEPLLRDYARLLASLWSPPDENVVRFYELGVQSVLAAEAPQWLYVGYVAGEPVATAELTVGGGVVGLYNIATIPAYRGRGIGSTMTRQPLIDAREAGHKVGVLQAAAEGVGIYQRLGFRRFGDITEYKPPES